MTYECRKPIMSELRWEEGLENRDGRVMGKVFEAPTFKLRPDCMAAATVVDLWQKKPFAPALNGSRFSVFFFFF